MLTLTKFEQVHSGLDNEFVLWNLHYAHKTIACMKHNMPVKSEYIAYMGYMCLNQAKWIY